MNRFEKLWEGSVKVRIDGRGMERFFNIAAQRGIVIEKIETKEIPAAEYDGNRHDRYDNHVEKKELEKEDKKQGKTVCFEISPRNFKRLKPIARKTDVRLRITEKHGFPFWLILGRRRSLWAGGLAAFFLLIYLSSFYVWDISFDGNHRFTDEMLLHFMDTIPVQCGMRKKEISCGDLEKQIRNAFPEIGWVSAELTGTRLTVHVRENDGILKAETGSDAPCELTAGSDGTVTKIIVRNGIVRVKAGDEVKTGDVLVSGKLPIYDDSETLVKTNLVHADAEVYAETTRTVTWKIPVVEEIRAGTGKKRKGVFFKFLDTEFCFLMPDLKKKAAGNFSWKNPSSDFRKIFTFRSTAGSLLPGNIFPTKKSSQNQKFRILLTGI